MSTLSMKVKMEWDSDNVTLVSGASVFFLRNCKLGAFPLLWEGVGISKDGAMDGLPTLVVVGVVEVSTTAFEAEQVEILAWKA